MHEHSWVCEVPREHRVFSGRDHLGDGRCLTRLPASIEHKPSAADKSTVAAKRAQRYGGAVRIVDLPLAVRRALVLWQIVEICPNKKAESKVGI